MSLGSLSSLTHMLLQRNELSGEIPAMLGDMSTLVWLGLYDNMLSGGIPMELGSLSSLERLYLHGNMNQMEYRLSWATCPRSPTSGSTTTG